MELFVQQVINGLTTGSIYCLVALGLTLVYGVMELPNFAHGSLYMLGAFATLTVMKAIGLNYWLCILISAVIMAAVGIAVQRLVYHPLRNAPHANYLIAAVGLMLFLECLALVIWGAEYWELSTPYDKVVNILGLTMTEQRLVVIVVTVVLLIGLNLFLKKTLLGASIEAASQDRKGASLVGIKVDQVFMLTFAVATALAAVAASLAGPINLIYPSMGHIVILKAFVIIVLGGMGRKFSISLTLA
jgi:branched-chain amino acid transport system permease protein